MFVIPTLKESKNVPKKVWIPVMDNVCAIFIRIARFHVVVMRKHYRKHAVTRRQKHTSLAVVDHWAQANFDVIAGVTHQGVSLVYVLIGYLLQSTMGLLFPCGFIKYDSRRFF